MKKAFLRNNGETEKHWDGPVFPNKPPRTAGPRPCTDLAHFGLTDPDFLILQSRISHWLGQKQRENGQESRSGAENAGFSRSSALIPKPSQKRCSVEWEP